MGSLMASYTKREKWASPRKKPPLCDDPLTFAIAHHLGIPLFSLLNFKNDLPSSSPTPEAILREHFYCSLPCFLSYLQPLFVCC